MVFLWVLAVVINQTCMNLLALFLYSVPERLVCTLKRCCTQADSHTEIHSSAAVTPAESLLCRLVAIMHYVPGKQSYTLHIYEVLLVFVFLFCLSLCLSLPVSSAVVSLVSPSSPAASSSLTKLEGNSPVLPFKAPFHQPSSTCTEGGGIRRKNNSQASKSGDLARHLNPTRLSFNREVFWIQQPMSTSI